jgi:hypothetical protein
MEKKAGFGSADFSDDNNHSLLDKNWELKLKTWLSF